MWRIGIDVGGTFTDLVAVDQRGVTTLVKTASTPDDPSIGLMQGLGELAEALGLEKQALLAATERIVHGTTVATNALLERKGAPTGLLTTEGHRDILEMREGLKEIDRYNLRIPPPVPLVPRHLRLGVAERIRSDGRVEIPLETASLDRAIAILCRAGVASVAIAFLHAFRNDEHERLAAERVRKAMPGAYVCTSSEVYPQIKEYERTSTTIVNAYVGPKVEGYLARLKERLAAAGYGGPIFIILSHGGIAPIAEAQRLAAATVLSGPAGGIAGARRAAELTGAENLIPLDMGGTSTDIALIHRATPSLAIDRSIAGERIALPSLEITTLGAGGGSIARVDAGGVLHVGPESAGAVPGPAAYGRGGHEPTVTDANVVLGRLDAAGFHGGKLTLDRPAAGAAVDRVARALGLSREAAADGLIRVVDARMAEGIRLVSVRRGIDPTGFALLSFGGAAGLHVSAIARQLSIKRILVPRIASVLSAWGMLATDIRYELTRTHIGDASAHTVAGVRAVFEAMEADGRARLAAVFGGPIRAERSADMRYGEQIFEINVALGGIDWRSADLIAAIADRFHDRHQELYTYALRGQEPVLVNARVAVIGQLSAPPEEPRLPRRPDAAPVRTARVWLDGWQELPVLAFDALAPGQVIDGPALVESATTTVLLRAGDCATTTALGWLDVVVEKEAGRA